MVAEEEKKERTAKKGIHQAVYRYLKNFQESDPYVQVCLNWHQRRFNCAPPQLDEFGKSNYSKINDSKNQGSAV